MQMNRLLKVMEDRCVNFESAYYAAEDKNIPAYIHDIFQNGMPADFRLIGATTGRPEAIPPALRSRCIEIFFRPLYDDELVTIATGAAKSGGMAIEEPAARLAAQFSSNGREAVNIVQMALGIARIDQRSLIKKADVEWICQAGRYQERPRTEVFPKPRVGCVNVLAVAGGEVGILLTVEASATRNPGKGSLQITGFVEQEENEGPGTRLRRKSTAMGSIENVLTVLKKSMEIPVGDYDIHVNAASGIAVDGPSAGIAICACVYSAISGLPIPGDVAMTGELSLTGEIKPVGGLRAKLEAAERAGVSCVYIPAGYSPHYEPVKMKVIATADISQLFEELFQIVAEEPYREEGREPALPALCNCEVVQGKNL